MSIDNALASLAVKDLRLSVAWYERLLGRPADGRPMPGLAEWTFQRGGGLQIYELPERAGAGSCTLAVSNIEDAVTHAKELGLDTSEQTSNTRVKTLMIVDPDGNHVAFAEALEGALIR